MIKIFDRLCLALVIAGALNWGLVGLFSFNLVEFLFGGQNSLLTRALYIIISACGIWCVTLFFKDDSCRKKD